MTDIHNDRAITLKRLAELLGVTVDTVRRRAGLDAVRHPRDPNFPRFFRSCDGRPKFNEDEVREYLRSLKEREAA